ncbi:MAG TPA: glycoside hydrolase domain-containing protein [Planctomycetota bacterium]|nr:glycoside hydrolase domain-containing protein [Planctomycetota bacterium]
MRLLSVLICLVLSLGCPSASAQDGKVLFWTGNPAGPHLDIVGDEAGASAGPVKIVGARNGTFSGKVVVCATSPLTDVLAKMTELRRTGGKGKIPLSQVQVRYATGWIKSGWLVQSKAGSTFDVLDAAPPAEPVPVLNTNYRKYHAWVEWGRSYLPVWVTVTVPVDAPAGEYAAALTVRASGAARTFPVTLTVHDWALPDSTRFTTWIETIQSPDTLAIEYRVPLWSEAHWKLIEQSLRYGTMLGNKTVYFPLICESNFGNAESSVRWVKQPGGSCRFDFSLVEKYLELQTKVQGKPRIVCFPVWDTFLEGGQFAGDIKFEPEEARKERLAYQGKGPEVTVVEASGETSKAMQPTLSDPEYAALWTPLIRELPGFLRKHGLEKALFFGTANDQVPARATLDLVGGVIPDAKWVIHAHSFYGGKNTKANFQYAAFVWGVQGFCTGGQGWKNPFLLVQFMRNMDDHFPITSYRLAPEVNVTGGQRGIGRIGLDYWPVIRNARGRRAGRAWERYPKANWRNLNITDNLLAPGRDGPIATARFEMLREGVQECEARIFIQTALDGKKITGALAETCRTVLADRDTFLRNAAIVQGKGRPWFDNMNPSDEAYLLYATTWQSQSERLYKAAADVSRKLGGK